MIIADTTDRSVWFEQVDTVFKEVLNSLIVDGKNLFAFTRLPETEYAVKVYPSASITPLSHVYDLERDCPEELTLISRDLPNHTAIYERTAIPFTLVYQIDFWARYRTDLNSMLMQWGILARNRFILSIPDVSGVLRDCRVTLLGDVVTREYLSEGHRLYQSSQTVEIEVEIDTGTQIEVPLVETIIFFRRN